MPRDRTPESRLALLREPSGFISKRCRAGQELRLSLLVQRLLMRFSRLVCSAVVALTSLAMTDQTYAKGGRGGHGGGGGQVAAAGMAAAAVVAARTGITVAGMAVIAAGMGSMAAGIMAGTSNTAVGIMAGRSSTVVAIMAITSITAVGIMGIIAIMVGSVRPFMVTATGMVIRIIIITTVPTVLRRLSDRLSPLCRRRLLRPGRIGAEGAGPTRLLSRAD